MCQALFVSGFEQSWSKVTMNFNSTTDDAIRKLVEFHLSALRSSTLCLVYLAHVSAWYLTTKNTKSTKMEASTKCLMRSSALHN